MAWFWWYLLRIWKYSFSERSWLVGDGCSNVLQQRLWEGVQHQAELWRLLQVERTKNGSKNLEQYMFKIIITMQVSSWWSLFSRCLQGLELLSGFEHYANVTLSTASVFFFRTNQQISPLSWTHPAVLWASTAMWSRSTPRRSRATWTRSQNLWWSRPDLLFSLKVKSGSAIQICDDNHRKQKFIERCMKNDDFQFIPAAPRPSYDTPMTRLEPTVAASLKQVRSNIFVF